MLRAAFLSAALLALAGSARAETMERTVKANTATPIGGFAGYHTGTCYAAGIPEAKIRQAPANGTVQILRREGTLPKSTQCPGAKVTGLTYVYMPRRGFRGTDEVTIDVPWSSVDGGHETLWSYTYRIRVE